MKLQLILIVSALCGACSSKIVVTQISDKPTKLDAPSAYYALPKTRITFTIPYTKRTYKPGELEGYFEAHKDEFGLQSAKPGDWGKCENKAQAGGKAQTRYRFGVIDKLTTSAVPDKDNIYALRMRADGLQDIKVGLELTPDLVVGAASGSSTSATSAIANVATTILSSSISHDEAQGADEALDATLKLLDNVVVELRKLNERRDQILFRNANVRDAEAILNRIEARQKELKKTFEGSYSEKPDSLAVVWIPSAHSANSAATRCCKVEKATRCKLDRGKRISPQLQCTHHDECMQPPDDALFVLAVEDSESFDIRKRLRAADNLRNSNVREKGFAYRIPAIADVSVHQRISGEINTYGEFETYIAQFGDVFRLPADIGTGSTEFAIAYYPEIGALKSLSASGVGMGTDPLQKAAVDILEPDDEVSKLERRFKTLDYEKRIRQLEDELRDTDSDIDTP